MSMKNLIVQNVYYKNLYRLRDTMKGVAAEGERRLGNEDGWFRAE